MSGKLVQLDLFRNEKAIADEEFKKMTAKSLRGLFARYNEIEYIILEMHKRVEKLCEDFYEKKDLGHTP
jgi:hypothetical protein